jgi:cytoskeletal protein RodZ
VAAATAVGFALGTGVTAAGHAVAGNGVRLTSAHHQQQQVSPPQQTQTQTTQQQSQTTQQPTTTRQHQQGSPGGKPAGGAPSRQVTIPSVSGQSQAAATRTLQSAGLRPVASSQTSDSVPSGDAIGTDPAAGTKVPRSSRVVLLVSISSGVVKVTVPDVTGQSLRDATARLEAAGLTSSVSSDPICAPQYEVGCVVDSEAPAAGSSVPSGRTVTLHEAAPKSR